MKEFNRVLLGLTVALLMLVGVSPAVFAIEYEVEMDNFVFVPHGLHINVGDIITWRNRDNVLHSSTSDTGIWDSGDLARDQRFSFTFTSPGSFPYHCTVHSSMRDTIFVTAPTGVDESGPDKPFDFRLSQNFPNPFNAQTTIEFALPQPSQVTVEVFDILGRKISTILDSQEEAGIHRLTWDAHEMQSGVYFYRVNTGSQSKTGRMTLLK